MSRHVDSIRLRLASGPLDARQLIEKLGISQPTLSRAIRALGDEVLRIGAARSIQYALRDEARGLADLDIYRVDPEAKIHHLGTLVPVRPDGFVMHEAGGTAQYSAGLPWWLLDMRPQGYLGRAYAARHGPALRLPERLTDWSDTHALKALLAHGHDGVGNLLPGEQARSHFLELAEAPVPIPVEQKAEAYVRLAQEAASGELPGSSAGGEQPKFTAYAMTTRGPRHVLVKFSERVEGPVSERWRDLLLAEHLALETLGQAGIAAARTALVCFGDQSFLEVERFDRVGGLGRRGLISLTALDAEFAGIGGAWPDCASALAAAGHIRPQAAHHAHLLWAFGHLIGNTDMHGGNLSFIPDEGPPYEIAPAYDMTPMAFAPRSGGGLPDTLPEPNIRAGIAPGVWRSAQVLAHAFVARVIENPGFSERFAPCKQALLAHLERADAKIARLA